jgi:hypothetical protein
MRGAFPPRFFTSVCRGALTEDVLCVDGHERGGARLWFVLVRTSLRMVLQHPENIENSMQLKPVRYVLWDTR